MSPPAIRPFLWLAMFALGTDPLGCLTAVGQADVSQVAASDPRLTSHLVANQWIRQSSDGGLHGRVLMPAASSGAIPSGPVSVGLVGEEDSIRTVLTDIEGNFHFDDIAPGLYSLIVRGAGESAILAVHVIDRSRAGVEVYPDQLQIVAAAVRWDAVDSSMVRYLPPQAHRNHPTVTRLVASRKAGYPLAIRGATEQAALKGISEKVCGENLYRVWRFEGGMKGRVHAAGAEGITLPDAARMNVFVYRQGVEVARRVTDSEGRFAIEKLGVGEYALLTVGSAGMAVVGFELVDSPSTEPTDSANGRMGRAQARRSKRTVSKAMLSDNPIERVVGGDIRSDEASGSGGFGPMMVEFQPQSCTREFSIQCAPVAEVVRCFRKLDETRHVSDRRRLSRKNSRVGEQMVAGECLAPLPGGGYFAGFHGGPAGGPVGARSGVLDVLVEGSGILGLAALDGIVEGASIGADDGDELVHVPADGTASRL